MKNWENELQCDRIRIMDFGGKSGKRFPKVYFVFEIKTHFKHKSFGQNYYNIEKKIHRYWGEKGYKYTITNT